MLLDRYVMHLIDTSSLPLADQAFTFVRQIAEGGPGFLSTHLAERFIVGTTAGANLVERDRFIQAALGRADLLARVGLSAPTLVSVDVAELGAAYILLTAHWAMPLPAGDLDLIEDLLVDRTGEEWVCQAYLLRQDLPTLVTGGPR